MNLKSPKYQTTFKEFFNWYWKTFRFWLNKYDALTHLGYVNDIPWRGYSLKSFYNDFTEIYWNNNVTITNSKYDGGTDLYTVIIECDRTPIESSPLKLELNVSVPYFTDDLKFKYFYENDISNIL